MAMLDVKKMAQFCNLTPRRLQQLAHQPGFPSTGTRGQYDACPVALWYTKYLQGLIEQRGAGADTTELRAAKLKLLTEQAEKVAVSNAVNRGDLLRVEEVQLEWTTRLSNCQRRLRAIPSTLGPQLTNKTDAQDVAARLLREINSALQEFGVSIDG